MHRLVATIFLICCLCNAGRTQEADTLAAGAVDSLAKEPEAQGFFKKNYPDPMKAGLMSLVIPGAGQAYNKRWWKVPLVYGALGGMIYAISWNTQQYNRFQTAYQASLKGEDNEFPGATPATLRAVRDGYDKNRQLSYVGFTFVYLLNGIEAFVDAHLQNFDISEDLSLKVRPEVGIDAFTLQPVAGIGLSIPLH